LLEELGDPDSTLKVLNDKTAIVQKSHDKTVSLHDKTVIVQKSHDKTVSLHDKTVSPTSPKLALHSNSSDRTDLIQIFLKREREGTKNFSTEENNRTENSYLQCSLSQDPSNKNSSEDQFFNPSTFVWDRYCVSKFSFLEEFFEFVLRKVAKFPQPPADDRCAAEAWIRKQGYLLWQAYIDPKTPDQHQERVRSSVPLNQSQTANPLLNADPDKAWMYEVADEAKRLYEANLEQLTSNSSLESKLKKWGILWQSERFREEIRQEAAAYPEVEITPSGPRLITPTD
jgi:hypothetical protein